MSSTPTLESYQLPEDLVELILECSKTEDESPQFIIIAAVEHLFKIPAEQRRAVLRGAARRRKG